MSEAPIERRYVFSTEHMTATSEELLPDLLEQMADFFRSRDSGAYSDFHRDSTDAPPRKAYEVVVTGFLNYSSTCYQYRAGGWWYRVIQVCHQVGVMLTELEPTDVFDQTLLARLVFATDDVPYFPAISLMMRNVVKSWLEDPTRVTAAAITRADDSHWHFQIAFSADPSSRWPNAFSLEFTEDLAGVPAQTRASAALVGIDKYIASFEDAKGRPAIVGIRAFDTPTACILANAIAGKSGCKWTSLTRVQRLEVELRDGDGNVVQGNWRQAAGSGSDVQRKAHCTYEAAAADDTIRIEIPSVAAGYVSRGSERSSTNPLDSLAMQTLLTEGGSPATSFAGAKFGRRIRLK